MSKLLSLIWVLLVVVMWIYSYGFVDLNLTLSSHPLVLSFIGSVQQLVYFRRSDSLIWFILLMAAMMFAYMATLGHAAKKNLTSFPWKMVSILALVSSLAYPMLSSDVFKYLFSAKMIMFYHANPYVVTPNFFEHDTWIRFMRWVHTTTPYGPVFTLLSIPYYVLGLGKFMPTLYLFKVDQIAWYLLTIWLTGKILELQKWDKTKIIYGQLFIALNPLILMEWLVNAHNDAIMITLLMLSLYLAQRKKIAWSWIALILSIGVKYVTVILAPALLFTKIIKTHFTLVIYYLLILLFLAPLLYHYAYQYQPWYVTWLIPLAALTQNRAVRVGVATYSMTVFSRYLYFVGTGSWLGTQLEHALMTFALPLLAWIYVGLKSAARKP